MLVDDPDVVTLPLIVRNVTTLPQSPSQNDVVYLTQQHGNFRPDLYVYNGQWVASTYVNPLK